MNVSKFSMQIIYFKNLIHLQELTIESNGRLTDKKRFVLLITAFLRNIKPDNVQRFDV